MNKCCDVKIIDFEDYTDLEFREVSNFFVKNCLGQRVYFLTRSREIAQMTNSVLFGEGFYSLSSGKVIKSSRENTVRASLNSKSRQGSRRGGR